MMDIDSGHSSSTLSPADAQAGLCGPQTIAAIEYHISACHNVHITDCLNHIFRITEAPRLAVPYRNRSILQQISDINKTFRIKTSIAIYATILLERTWRKLDHNHRHGIHEVTQSQRIDGTYDDMVYFYLACLLLSTIDIAPTTDPIYSNIVASISRTYNLEDVERQVALIRKLLGNRVTVDCRKIVRWMKANRGLCALN
ncbi:hypothetical protein H4R35_003145 [Dimargaris xerosporica]|nr:hypothetical protein H4R35_003145 [Dimargaris xerosporica]